MTTRSGDGNDRDTSLGASICPNRPEWAAPVPAISPEGYCFHCSKVRGEWVACEGSDEFVFEVDVRPETTPRA